METLHHQSSPGEFTASGEAPTIEHQPRLLEDYADTFNGIRAQLDHKVNAKGLDKWGAIDELWESYVVEQADDPEMSRFAAVLLRAPLDKHNQDGLNDYAKIKSHMTREDWQAEADMKYSRVESNHLLRSVLQDQQDNISRKNMVEWLGTMMADMKLAEGSIDGVYAEIAVAEALADGAETYQFVTYGTVDDDLHGGDIVGRTLNGNIPVAIDVKAGKQMPSGREDSTGIHLTVGVPTNLWDDHGRMDPESLDGVRKLVLLAHAQRQQVDQGRRIA